MIRQRLGHPFGGLTRLPRSHGPASPDKPAHRQIDCVRPAPRTNGGTGLTPHQAPVMHDPLQKSRQHQPPVRRGNDALDQCLFRLTLRINPRSPKPIRVKISDLARKPRQVQNLVDPHQDMIFREQVAQRPADEKLRLIPFLPTQNRKPPLSCKDSESDRSDFFNSPRGTDFSPGLGRPAPERGRAEQKTRPPAHARTAGSWSPCPKCRQGTQGGAGHVRCASGGASASPPGSALLRTRGPPSDRNSPPQGSQTPAVANPPNMLCP